MPIAGTYALALLVESGCGSPDPSRVGGGSPIEDSSDPSFDDTGPSHGFVPQRHPGGSLDPCDGIDNNGDGEVDEGWPDTDKDGVADCVDRACAVERGDSEEVALPTTCVQDPWTVGGDVSAFELRWGTFETDGPCRLAVGDVDGDGVAEILCSADQLWVFDGVTGDLEWESTAFDEASPVLLADLNGDGIPDIAGMTPTGSVIALEGTGGVLWESSANLGQQFSPGEHATNAVTPAMQAYDLDGNGSPELILEHGIVQGIDGALVAWLSEEDMIGDWPRDMLVSDPDLDGHPELCDLFLCRNSAGAVLWEVTAPNTSTRAAWPIAVQADADQEAEIMWLTHGWTILTESDGSEIGRYPLDESWRLNRAAVADFDGDGISEYCMDDGGSLKVAELDGTVLWSIPLTETTWGWQSTCSTFDLDGDGDQDVLFSGENFWGAFDGRTGATLVMNTDWLSGNHWEIAIVFDVDGDGASEIITSIEPVAYQTTSAENPTPRIAVYDNPDGAWAPTFPLWPYETYSGVGMNADGTVQRTADPSWTTTGLWRGSPANPILGFDLLPEITDACVSSCTDPEGQIRLAVRLVDLGPYEAPESTAFTVYALQEDGSRTRLETVTLADIAASAGDWFDGAPYVDNGFASPTYEVVTTFEVAQHGLEIVAGDHGAGNLPVDECAEENNTLSWSPAELCE